LDELQRLRLRIDEIDRQITSLLGQRHENARLLGRVKRARGLSLRDAQREKIILRNIDRSSSQIGLDPKLVEPVFQKIFNLSVEAQKNTPVQGRPSLKGLRILIVGGTGGMGRLLARFFSLLGGQVKVAGRSLERTRTAAKELEVEPGTLLDATTSDMVFISVPIVKTERVAVETASLMKEESLISDISSVKTRVSDRVAGRIPENLEYVSLHPLFSPDADHLYDQNIIAVPYRVGERWKRLDGVLRGAHARVYSMTATRHDQEMAYAQGLHHFALIALGLCLDRMSDYPATSSLRETEARIEKLLAGWDTIQGIQRMNPFVPALRQKFVETCQRKMTMGTGDLSRARRRLAANVQKWSRKQ
jgi:chorismate mutase/prephenate dehydrogenase